MLFTTSLFTFTSTATEGDEAIQTSTYFVLRSQLHEQRIKWHDSFTHLTNFFRGLIVDHQNDIFKGEDRKYVPRSADSMYGRLANQFSYFYSLVCRYIYGMDG